MNNPEPEKTYFVLIPGYVDNRKDLTRTQKYIFGLVNGLAHAEGYCYASNYYLSQRAGCSESTVTKTVSKLEKLGLWSVSIKTYTKEDGADPRQLGTKREITPFQLGVIPRGVVTSSEGGSNQFRGVPSNNSEHSIKSKSKSSSSEKTTTDFKNLEEVEDEVKRKIVGRIMYECDVSPQYIHKERLKYMEKAKNISLDGFIGWINNDKNKTENDKPKPLDLNRYGVISEDEYGKILLQQCQQGY